MQETQYLNTEPNTTETTSSNLPHLAVITQSTTEVEAIVDISLVTTEDATAPHVAEHEKPTQQLTSVGSVSNTDVVIPESIDGEQAVKASNQQQKQSSSLLPGIGVFLSKTCTIPLIRCDFEQIKKTVELQSIQGEIKQSHSDKMPSEESGNVTSTNSLNKSSTTVETDQAEACTATWKRMVIDYKKFLEDYADEPPSPLKKKREVDLKQRPSKTRIAAEKYSHSKYFTKPTHLPRPVCRGTGKRHAAPALCSNEPQLEPTNQTP